MRPCSFPIGHTLCPCEEYEAGSTKGVCDACGHRSSHHGPPPAVSSLPAPLVAGTSSRRTHMPTSLFQQLLNSVPRGVAALQETSNGLRKQQVSILTTAAVEHALTIEIGSVADEAVGCAECKPIHEGTQVPVPFCCLHRMWSSSR